jgi:hypothetical protein
LAPAAAFRTSRIVFGGKQGLCVLDSGAAPPFTDRAAGGTLNGEEPIEGLNSRVGKIRDERAGGAPQRHLVQVCLMYDEGRRAIVRRPSLALRSGDPQLAVYSITASNSSHS